MNGMTDREVSEAAKAVLELYGFEEAFTVNKVFIRNTDRDDYFKLIFRADFEDGKRLVVKLLHEDESGEQKKIENQSVFSEFLRQKWNQNAQALSGGRQILQ